MALKNCTSDDGFFLLLAGYFWIVGLFVDRDFCARDGGSVLVAVKLSLAIAVFDSILSVAIARLLYFARQTLWFDWLGPIIATLVVGVVVATLPSWIHRGYGVFRLRGTWASVSCAFTEGYGIVFPIMMAPALALATFVKAAWLMRSRPRNTKGLERVG